MYRENQLIFADAKMRNAIPQVKLLKTEYTHTHTPSVHLKIFSHFIYTLTLFSPSLSPVPFRCHNRMPRTSCRANHQPDHAANKQDILLRKHLNHIVYIYISP